MQLVQYTPMIEHYGAIKLHSSREIYIITEISHAIATWQCILLAGGRSRDDVGSSHNRYKVTFNE